MGSAMTSSMVAETKAEIEEQQAPANSAGERILRATCAARAAADEWLQVLTEQAQRDSELGEARLECGVHADDVDEARGDKEGSAGALHDRNGDAGDGDDGEERHLEAGVEERVRDRRTSRQSAAKPRLLRRPRSR